MPLINLNIDGREVRVEQREPILNAIRELGIDVPTLCHMDGLEPYGVCRLCIVEARRGKRKRLVTSCNYPADEGHEIYTNTDDILAHRSLMAELLLARCPEVKRVQEIAAKLNVTRTRFKTIKSSDCVLCGLCIRVCDEIVGAAALGFMDRGCDRDVGTPYHVHPDACIGCGACTYVCPTGAMQMEAETREIWRKELFADQRFCRYARLGLVSSKICPNSFDCATCEVDQRLFDEFGTHPALVVAPGLRRLPVEAGHFTLVEDRFYSRGHAWVKPVRENVRVGLDDFALRLIGGVTQVVLEAEQGKVVRRGDLALSVASNGRRARMLFPVSGKVLHVNSSLKDEPSLIDEDCYDRGWLYVMEPHDFGAQVPDLVGRDKSRHWTLAESDRLMSALTKSGGAALSDGGELLPDFSRKIKDEVWTRLTEMFFLGQGAR